MRTRILPLLITMLFALSLASNAAANEKNPTKSAMSRLTESPAEGRSHRGPWEFPEEGGQHSRFFSLLFRLKSGREAMFFNTNQ